MGITSTQVIDTFSSVASKLNFTLIEREQTISTAVYKHPLKFKEYFFKCLPFQSKRVQNVTAVRVVVGYSEKKCQKTILIKGLYGNKALINQYIQTFHTYFEKSAKDSINLRV